MNRLRGLLLFIFCFSQSLEAGPHVHTKEYIILHGGKKAGMFSMFTNVLALLYQYDKDCYDGIEVNFYKEGLYYSKEYGNNWWTYYCKPIKIGEKINVKKLRGVPLPPDINIEKISRYEANRLIKKYIHIKPEIIEKISLFEKEHFNGDFIISVHYRGTDKILEAPPVTYSQMITSVCRAIQNYGKPNYKIFVATDEQQFLDQMIALYGERVCYNKEAIRSQDLTPVHFRKDNRYQCGLDALMDSILLSKGNYLIRMSSNLSLWSTFFNPDIPVEELNQRW